MINPILITKKQLLLFYKKAEQATHKGLQGHAVIIAGSYGKIGAAVLASKAALKSGCGLVTAFVPKCGNTILQVANPEVMTVTDSNKKCISNIDFEINCHAIGIGPGIGQEEVTQQALFHFFKKNRTPLVIDADALNILALHPEWLSLISSKCILTPHPKELERLIGKWHSEDEKFQKTIQFSKKLDSILVMKGAPTYIIYQGLIYKNTTGNAALATAGSGDTLTGIVAGLLAQGYQPIEAAQLGVFLHGLTADLALPFTGTQSFIASDCIDYLGKAFLEIEK